MKPTELPEAQRLVAQLNDLDQSLRLTAAANSVMAMFEGDRGGIRLDTSQDERPQLFRRMHDAAFAGLLEQRREVALALIRLGVTDLPEAPAMTAPETQEAVPCG